MRGPVILCFIFTTSILVQSIAIESNVTETALPSQEADVTTGPPSVDTAVTDDVTVSDDVSTTEETVTLNVEDNDELPASLNETDTNRLLAGTKVAATGEYPYALHVLSKTPSGDRPCTAALLTTDYAITSASCVYDATTITVTAATLDATDGTATTIRTGLALVHPKYYSNTQEHDIALIKLSPSYVPSSTIGTINIALKFNTDDTHDIADKTMRILAFGEIAADTATYALNTQLMRTISHSRCVRDMRTKNNIRVALNQDCLSTESSTVGGCNPADRGGIVTYKFGTDAQYTLVGVLNYYYTCASSVPNLFTRVGPYWDLIRKYIPTYDNVG